MILRARDPVLDRSRSALAMPLRLSPQLKILRWVSARIVPDMKPWQVKVTRKQQGFGWASTQ
jgi:hypothetical protein